MCNNLFPSFSQSQLVGGALDGSVYASGFSTACKEFTPALKNMPPDTWYLVFGLPFGGLPTVAGLSMCLAVLPNCGSNSKLSTSFSLIWQIKQYSILNNLSLCADDLQILAGISG